MYRDLLVSSFGLGVTSGEAPEDPSQLLDRALDARRRLHESETGGADVDRDIARNIDYDLALLRLCAAHDVDCAPDRFDHPLVERKRLERELESRGIDLAALCAPC